jgi:hypothetical protein
MDDGGINAIAPFVRRMGVDYVVPAAYNSPREKPDSPRLSKENSSTVRVSGVLMYCKLTAKTGLSALKTPPLHPQKDSSERNVQTQRLGVYCDQTCGRTFDAAPHVAARYEERVEVEGWMTGRDSQAKYSSCSLCISGTRAIKSCVCNSIRPLKCSSK